MNTLSQRSLKSLLTSDGLALHVGCNVRIDELSADADAFERLDSGLLVPRRVLSSQQTHNLIVTDGLNWVRDRLLGTETDQITHMARGSGSTAVTAADSALDTETERDAVTSTVVSSASITWQYLEGTTSNNGQTFREAGLFDAASSGTMFNRWVHTDIEKTSAKQILYSVVLTLASA